MLLASLLALAGATAAPPPLDVIAGVRLGDGEAVARRQIRRRGQVVRQEGAGGAVTLTAGDASATICEGQVVKIVLVIGHGLHDFASAGQFFLRTHGPALSPEIYALDSSELGTAEAATTDIVRLKWAKAPAFSLAYSQAGGADPVFVALNAPNPCDRVGGEPTPE